MPHLFYDTTYEVGFTYVYKENLKNLPDVLGLGVIPGFGSTSSSSSSEIIVMKCENIPIILLIIRYKFDIILVFKQEPSYGTDARLAHPRYCSGYRPKSSTNQMPGFPVLLFGFHSF